MTVKSSILFTPAPMHSYTFYTFYTHTCSVPDVERINMHACNGNNLSITITVYAVYRVDYTFTKQLKLEIKLYIVQTLGYMNFNVLQNNFAVHLAFQESVQLQHM